MAMPEAAMNEYGHSTRRKYYVRSTRQTLTLQPESQASSMKRSAYNQLGASVFSPYASHHFGSRKRLSALYR